MKTEHDFRSFCEAMDRRYNHPSQWPYPAPKPPRWWHFKDKARERELKAVSGLTLTANERWWYWREVWKGQSVYDDVGGAVIRRYRAMFGLATEPVVTQADVLRELWRVQQK
jgi:hypothetical protein